MKKHHLLLFVLMGMLCVAMIGCATKDEVTITDQDIADTIKEKLEKESGPQGPFKIDIFVNDGDVSLDGQVSSSDIEQEAMETAKDTVGVKDVKSFIELVQEG